MESPLAYKLNNHTNEKQNLFEWKKSRPSILIESIELSHIKQEYQAIVIQKRIQSKLN